MPEEQMTAYDAADINYMIDHFTIPELRQQKYKAEVLVWVNEQFDDELHAGRDRAFLQMVTSALELAIATKPKPRPIPGHVDVDAVKAKADIVTVAERYTKLRKAGARYYGRCPLHDDKGPSFVVYSENQSWHCFGACGRGGDVIALVMAAEHLDFKGAVASLGG